MTTINVSNLPDWISHGGTRNLLTPSTISVNPNSFDSEHSVYGSASSVAMQVQRFYANCILEISKKFKEHSAFGELKENENFELLQLKRNRLKTECEFVTSLFDEYAHANTFGFNYKEKMIEYAKLIFGLNGEIALTSTKFYKELCAVSDEVFVFTAFTTLARKLERKYNIAIGGLHYDINLSNTEREQYSTTIKKLQGYWRQTDLILKKLIADKTPISIAKSSDEVLSLFGVNSEMCSASKIDYLLAEKCAKSIRDYIAEQNKKIDKLNDNNQEK